MRINGADLAGCPKQALEYRRVKAFVDQIYVRVNMGISGTSESLVSSKSLFSTISDYAASIEPNNFK